MPPLDIYVLPAPILRRKATSVEAVDAPTQKLMSDMLETMYEAKGIGLAAPQIGISKRVIVIDCSEDDDPPEPLLIANPKITWQSDETATLEEGCLSIPGYRGDVKRPAEVKISYLDDKGKKQELHAEGLLAACLQHEIDHLDGILFIDHLSRVKRDMILRKIAKDNRLNDEKT